MMDKKRALLVQIPGDDSVFFILMFVQFFVSVPQACFAAWLRTS